MEISPGPVQSDPHWPTLVKHLSDYQSAFEWTLHGPDDEDDSTVWAPMLLDSAAAIDAYEHILADRNDLAARHNVRAVELAVCDQARIQLDGKDFRPGRDIGGMSFLEANGRPSSAIGDAIQFATAVDVYAGLDTVELCSEWQSLVRDDEVADAWDDRATGRRIAIRWLAVKNHLEARGLALPSRRTPKLSPFGACQIDPARPPVEPPTSDQPLPAWIAALNVTEVVVSSSLTPLTVRLRSVDSLTTALDQAQSRLDADELFASHHIGELVAEQRDQIGQLVSAHPELRQFDQDRLWPALDQIDSEDPTPEVFGRDQALELFYLPLNDDDPPAVKALMGLHNAIAGLADRRLRYPATPARDTVARLTVELERQLQARATLMVESGVLRPGECRRLGPIPNNASSTEERDASPMRALALTVLLAEQHGELDLNTLRAQCIQPALDQLRSIPKPPNVGRLTMG